MGCSGELTLVEDGRSTPAKTTGTYAQCSPFVQLLGFETHPVFGSWAPLKTKEMHQAANSMQLLVERSVYIDQLINDNPPMCSHPKTVRLLGSDLHALRRHVVRCMFVGIRGTCKNPSGIACSG